jgi:MerR family transcriptional regulator, heat shock protein HspR
MAFGNNDEDRKTRAVYVISVAAELAGVHPQTLRIYERRGLVGPARTGGGSRRYSDQDIALLRRIQQLTADGHNLEGVRRILELEEENERLRTELSRLQQQYRRDLVPFKDAPTQFRPRSS